jgi:CBS domain-containing protein
MGWKIRRGHHPQEPRVEEAMTRGAVCVDRYATVAAGAARMAEEGVGALPVCADGDRLVGVLTDRDIVVRAIADGDDPRAVTVGECLEGEPVSVAPDAPLDEALERMQTHGVRRLPVTRAGRVTGIITQADIAARDAGRAGRLEQALTRRGGDARSASWWMRRPYGAGVT